MEKRISAPPASGRFKSRAPRPIPDAGSRETPLDMMVHAHTAPPTFARPEPAEGTRVRGDESAEASARDGRAGRSGERALSEADRAALAQLQARDREVRAHERAHVAAAGGLARGGPRYETVEGPDGRRYATGGEVGIDTSKGASPEATVAKARQMRRAALAPASPSAQDRSVAMRASAMEREAQAEILQAAQAEKNEAAGTRTETDRAACPHCGGRHQDPSAVVEMRRGSGGIELSASAPAAGIHLDTVA